MKKMVIALICAQLLLPCLAVRADDDPMSLLTTASATLRKAHSLTASYVVEYEYPPKPGRIKRPVLFRVGRIACQLPNLSHKTIWHPQGSPVRPSGPPSVEYVSTASTCYILDQTQQSGRFEVDGGQPNPKDGSAAFTETPIEDFFVASSSAASAVDKLRKAGKLHFIKMDPAELWNGATYKVVEYEYQDNDKLYELSDDQKKTLPGGVVVRDEKCYIGADKLIHRIVDHENIDWTQDCSISDLKLDPKIGTTEFTLPAGCTRRPPPAPMLANGTAAPDFTVQDAKGNAVHLSDYLGKVVVLDFWSTKCVLCLDRMPSLQVVAAKYQASNVVILAVNVWDTKDEFYAWLPSHRQLSALHFLIDKTTQGQDVASKLYKALGLPTEYVIDKKGNVVANFVGYQPDESALETAIKSVM